MNRRLHRDKISSREKSAAQREGMNSIRIRPTLAALDLREFHDATLILDIDCAIAPDRQVALSEGVLATIRELASRNTVYVFSNHRNMARNRIVASKVSCALFETPHRKPNPATSSLLMAYLRGGLAPGLSRSGACNRLRTAD